MNDNIKTSKVDKFTGWLKNNIENAILVILAIAYIFRGITSIEESGKTAIEIIADGTVAFLCGYIVKSIMNRKGILAGFTSEKFIATTNSYGRQKIEIASYVEELTPFCDMKNKDRLKQEQSVFLLKHAMNYSNFIQGHYDNDETKKDILKECRNIKVFQYTPTLLTNAYDTATEEKELLNTSLKSFNIKQYAGDFSIGAVMFFVFGYFTIRNNGWDWAAIFWYALQIAIFMTIGLLKYMNAYFFVSETLRGKINRVMSIVDEFKNIREKNPNIFKVVFETAEEKTTVECNNAVSNVEKKDVIEEDEEDYRLKLFPKSI